MKIKIRANSSNYSNKQYYLSGYTIVELIVVMGIISVLIGLSLTGLVALRESSRLNKNVQDFTSESKTFLSQARSNVYTTSELDYVGQSPSCVSITSSPFAPDAIGYYFDPTTHQAKTIKCVSTSISTTGDFCCTPVANAGTYKQGDKNITFAATCSGVVFEYSTGQIYRFNPDGQGNVDIPDNSSTVINVSKEACTVTITNEILNRAKEILFDSNNNAIVVQ